jgi:hypothetical protein
VSRAASPLSLPLSLSPSWSDVWQVLKIVGTSVLGIGGLPGAPALA